MPDDLPAYSHHVPENEPGKLPDLNVGRNEVEGKGVWLDVAPNQRCSLRLRECTHIEPRPPQDVCLLTSYVTSGNSLISLTGLNFPICKMGTEQ